MQVGVKRGIDCVGPQRRDWIEEWIFDAFRIEFAVFTGLATTFWIVADLIFVYRLTLGRAVGHNCGSEDDSKCAPE